MKKTISAIFFLFAVAANNLGQTDMNISNLVSFDGEPTIAINPTNSNNIIAGWMRLRLDGKFWIATRASFDGGTTWSPINFLPHDTAIYQSADVTIQFHRTGIAYLSYVDWDAFTTPDTAGAVFISKSTDGGLSWSTPNKIIDYTEIPGFPFDRPWLSIDNSGGPNDGTIYFTCMNLYSYTGQHHIYFRSSADSGTTWSNIKQVDDSLFSPGVITVSYAPISVGADGKVYITYMSYDASISPFVRLYIATTTDTGNTFQRFVVDNVFPAYQKLPFYTIAADPVNSGHVIVSWCDTRYGDLDVLLSKSTDGGQIWTIPVRINDDPVNNKIVQDQVWSAFSPTGELALAWRDRRMGDTSSLSPFDIYAAVSLDGGNSFNSNIRLSSTSSLNQSLPCCNSFIGLGLTDSILIADWGGYQGDTLLIWDIYVNKISILTAIETETFDVDFALQVFPNPANSEIIIQCSFPQRQITGIKIYNVFGKEVETKIIRNSNGFIIRSSNLVAGIYFLKIITNNLLITKKLQIIK